MKKRLKVKVEKLARGLGWFSIGIGLVELLATDRLAQTLGMEHRTKVLRLYGMREIGAGVGLLVGSPSLLFWMLTRIGGDVLDIAALKTALAPKNRKRRNAAVALGITVAITALDVVCTKQLSE